MQCICTEQDTIISFTTISMMFRWLRLYMLFLLDFSLVFLLPFIEDHAQLRKHFDQA